MDPAELVNIGSQAGSRIITESVLGALLVGTVILWAIDKWIVTPKQRDKDQATQEALRLELKAELLQERKDHQATRDAATLGQEKGFQVAASYKETFETVMRLISQREPRE